MELIRITRLGKAKSSASSPVQCKHTGHENYGYEVRVSCPKENRDKNGWIIDNRDIKAVVDQVFADHGSKSCEDMTCMIAEAVQVAARKIGVIVLDVYVRLWPRKEAPHETLDTEDYAFFEYSLSGNF